MSGFNFDTVKSFFRTNLTRFNQEVRHVIDPTVDAEYDNLIQITDGLAEIADRTSARIKKLATAVDLQVQLVHEASLDPPASQFIWDDMSKLNAKLAHAASSLSPHSGYAKKVLMEHAIQLDRFVSDVKALDALKQERKHILLEYDYFRTKTAALRADPPSDPERIPRNEGRALEFKNQLDTVVGKLKQALQGLVSTGERLCATAHSHIVTELHRFCDEGSRAWKAANLAVPTQAIAPPPPPSAATSATAASASAAASGSGGLTPHQQGGGGASLAPPPPQPGTFSVDNKLASSTSGGNNNNVTPPTTSPTTAVEPPSNFLGGSTASVKQQDLNASTSSSNFLASTMGGAGGDNRPPPVNANPTSKRNFNSQQQDDPFAM